MRPLLAFAFAPVLALGFCAAAPAAGVPHLPGPAAGSPAPDFALTTVTGRRVRLADYRGRVLVLNVWGSWCPPCRIEQPDLIAEAKRDGVRVAFLGVNTTEPAVVVRAFAAAKGVPYPEVATGAQSGFARAYAIRNYPSTFVIDAHGIVRAVHADNVLPREQLSAYIAAAERGESAPLQSAFQRRLDALLAPAQYDLSGTPDGARVGVRRAAAAIDRADAMLDDAMDDPSRDHDLLATHQEEETLRSAAIAALAPVAAGAADRLLLARLRGDEAAELARPHDADLAYREALAIDPADTASLHGDAAAAAALGDTARVVALDETIVRQTPSAGAFVALGRARARAGDLDAAERAFARARALAAADAARLAWTLLYEGRAERDGGDLTRARASFTAASAAAQRVAAKDPRRDWYLEQAQEANVALGLAHGRAPSLSLAPWTGPDLAGAIASTIKYRLIVTGRPGAQVPVVAAGLPPHWIGSFCSDRVCSPFRTTVRLPPSGVKIVEFQLVPQAPLKNPATVRLSAPGASAALVVPPTPPAG